VSGDESGFLKRLERYGTAAENASLVILLGAMMVLAVGQIVMRIFFSTGVVWGDELLKLMVLWIAMIASIAASRSDRHLRIDIVSHFVPERFARVPRLMVDAFAASMCGILAWQSYRFVQLSIEFEDTVLVNIPSWIAHSILPFAFALMCYRFFLAFIRETVILLRSNSS
jgi:TRAP-type C4-dicarboxylate transport system permease small subunit